MRIKKNFVIALAFSTITKLYLSFSLWLSVLSCLCRSPPPHRIDFPPEVIRGETLFTNMIIDETTSQPSNNCDDVFVYITDTVEPGEKTAHRFQLHTVFVELWWTHNLPFPPFSSSNYRVWQWTRFNLATITPCHVSRSKLCAIEHIGATLYTDGWHRWHHIWPDYWRCLLPTVGYRSVHQIQIDLGGV